MNKPDIISQLCEIQARANPGKPRQMAIRPERMPAKLYLQPSEAAASVALDRDQTQHACDANCGCLTPRATEIVTDILDGTLNFPSMKKEIEAHRGIFSFVVLGDPIPKGSAKAFRHRHTGKIIVQQSNREKQKPWAERIGRTAIQAGCKPAAGGVTLGLKFFLKRPKAHSGKNGLRLSAPQTHTTKPDIDKLLRCVMDALTGIAYLDDAQVVGFSRLSKEYGEPARVEITIEKWGK